MVGLRRLGELTTVPSARVVAVTDKRAEYDREVTQKMSLWDRVTDFIARLHRDPPVCDTCGARMRFMDGAWECPYLFSADHRYETDDGTVVFTTTGDTDV